MTAILSRITDDRGRSGTLPVRLCAECLSALPVSGVGMSLVSVGGPPSGMVLAATNRRSRWLEELQYSLDEGPGVEASRTGRPLLQPDLPTAGPIRWPKFCKAALPAGIRAVFSFPLGVDGACLGVLTLHRDTPVALTRVELAESLAFADAAAAVLSHLRDRAADRTGLTGPDERRGNVQQATGMITTQLGVSSTEALLRLRAHAYATGRPVTAVAADVVGHRLQFGRISRPG